jgi:signal transduction histidine kinase
VEKRIGSGLKSLMSKVRDIIFLIKMDENYAANLEKEMLRYLNEVKHISTIKLDYRLDEIGVRLDAKKAMHVLKIFFEWMSNVFRHANPDCIKVRWRLINGTVSLSIENTGAAFSWKGENGTGGNGLRNIHYRADQIGARKRSFGMYGRTFFVCRFPVK